MRDEDITAANDSADEAVDDAVRFADESPDPAPDDLYSDVTLDGAGAIAWRTRPSTPAE
jgi:TPP-dependent pyruvate/acetoin dehydrogenase alpha subunit